jgi:hypothetical protein
MALEIIIKARYEGIALPDGEEADAAVAELSKAIEVMLVSTNADSIFVDDAVAEDAPTTPLNQAQKEALTAIDNFILHFTSDDIERARMHGCALAYVEGDHALQSQGEATELLNIGTIAESEREIRFDLSDLYGCPLGFDDVVIENARQEVEDRGDDPDDYEYSVEAVCVLTAKNGSAEAA